MEYYIRLFSNWLEVHLYQYKQSHVHYITMKSMQVPPTTINTTTRKIWNQQKHSKPLLIGHKKDKIWVLNMTGTATGESGDLKSLHGMDHSKKDNLDKVE